MNRPFTTLSFQAQTDILFLLAKNLLEIGEEEEVDLFMPLESDSNKFDS